jgi:hypothetical protein
MTRRPRATVRSLRWPDLARDAVRIESDCRYSVPTAVERTETRGIWESLASAAPPQGRVNSA